MKSGRIARIALVGKEAVSGQSEIGKMLIDLFSKYPASQQMGISYFKGRAAVPQMHIPAFPLYSTSWLHPGRVELNRRLMGQMKKIRAPASSLLYKDMTFGDLPRGAWERTGGIPDVVYSTCSSAEELAFLHHVLRKLPRKVPVIQHFVNVDFSQYEYMMDLYQELLPSVAAVWVHTKQALYAIKHVSSIEPELVPALHVRMPKSLQKKRVNNQIKVSLITRPYSFSAAVAAQRILKSSESRIGKLVLARDFRKADVGVIAATGKSSENNQSGLYRLPLRIGEYCARGIPLVVFSHPGTATHELVEERELGIVVDPTDPMPSLRKLKHFLLDREWRECCALKARRFAERELDVSLRQPGFYKFVNSL